MVLQSKMQEYEEKIPTTRLIIYVLDEERENGVLDKKGENGSRFSKGNHHVN